MEENFAVFDFQMDKSDMEQIAALDTGKSCFFDHRDPAVVENLAGLVRNVQQTMKQTWKDLHWWLASGVSTGAATLISPGMTFFSVMDYAINIVILSVI